MAKIRYSVPISLWFVEKSQRDNEYFICVIIVYIYIFFYINFEIILGYTILDPQM